MRHALLFCAAFLSFHLLSAQQTIGLFSRLSSSEDGYILLPSLYNTETYLIDKCGKKINSWASAYWPAMSAYLLPDGSLLRPGVINNTHFTQAGNGGLIQQFDWKGNLVWSYQISSGTECQHHDICPLPNGNILAIAWEYKSEAEAVENGRDSTNPHDEVWPDKIVELEPNGIDDANIVWEWHIWDHLIQDAYPSKLNFGDVGKHPELIDVNFATAGILSKDWTHTNAVVYNAALDQIMISVHGFDEFWIIDHSTTAAEAASHTGGKAQHGGDLLYRWGNPQAYRQGTVVDHHFYGLHDVQWIPAGRPDAGKIMVFNNGAGRPDGSYSSVEVINPPVDASGNYQPATGSGYLPMAPDWVYEDSNRNDFFSAVMSGTERLPNGNTLITECTKGNLFEVTPAGTTVWKYINPIGQNLTLKQGSPSSGNFVFKAKQYMVDYPGLAGRSLAPGAPLEINPLNYSCNMIKVTGVSAISTQESPIAISNPFGGSISMLSHSELKNAELNLYNAIGSLCASWKMDLKNGETVRLEISGSLAPGFYTLQVRNQESIVTRRLVHD